MNKLNIKGEDLKSIGYPEGKAIGIAIKLVEQNYCELEREEVMAILTKVLQYPENFLDDEILESIAQELIEKPNEDATIALKEIGGS